MKKFRILLLTIVAILYLIPLQAQNAGGIRILGVAVQGNKTITENSVKIQSGLMEGNMVSFEDISSAIQRLWKLRLFADIQVLVDKATDAGVFLIIKVEEYPRLATFEITGNKKIKKSKFDEVLSMLPGTVLSPHKIKESIRQIKDIYKEDGFLLVEITEKLSDAERENTQNLTLEIEENRRVRIKDIRFSGNEAFSDGRLRRTMKDTRSRNLLLLKLGEFEREKYAEDKDKLLAFYRNQGYRDAQILSDSISYGEDGRWMYIDFDIYEGNRYKYGDITFSGNHLYTDVQLQTVLNIKPGDWFDQEEFEKAIYDRINGIYMDRGYLFFQINPKITPISENEIDVHLEIQENHQVSINQVNIVGNDRTDENVIRRELRMFPGDIFSREALIRSQREIFILNYFSNVEPDVVPVNDEEVDIEITVEEKSSDRANMSISISQLHGLIGGGGVEFNNFLGRGQKVNISYQQGVQYSVLQSGTTPYRSFSVGFTDPWVFDTPNLLGASFTYSERGGSSYYYYPFDLNILGGSLRWGRRFRWPDNYFRGTWAFSAHRKQYKNIDDEYLETYLEGYDKTRGVSITQVLSRDSRDRPEFPTMGSVFSLTSTYSGGFLGGTEHFHKHNFSIEHYIPAFSKFVLYNSCQFGIVKKLRREGIIPPDERFIMGGSGMIYGVALRGYDDNQVGPVSGGSYYSFGGESLFKYSMELRFPVSENPTIYALGFMEAGNTWENLSKTDPFDLKRSAGIGVRFYMPALGMIGIDFGYGFDDIDSPGEEGYRKPEGWKTHFIFGMPF